uniref:Mitogen-activated protein kinase n=1 Tax=Cafeteria roenbergensis TaxID=33653 RepID=A0A7S0JZD0_CAFRO
MAAAAGPTRKYHVVMLGRTQFCVDTRFTNLRPIGRGAYGLVAAADDLVSGRKVAIKRVSKVFADLIDAKRILREIKLLRHLGGHDNIIEIIDIMTGPPESEDFDTLYIVTQLYECDLDRIIRSAQALTDQHFQYFVYQMLRGLKFIHSANVIHRDLKPSNLLVNSNCDLAICDYGLARGVSKATEKDLTSYVVTRWYRAPEILCEATTYGTAADVWGVGCIFGELLGRKTLFRGSSSKQQVELIISVLGSPTDEDLRGVEDPNIVRLIKSFPRRAPVPWTHIFPDANPLALDLLSKMLTFSQFDRISVDEALAHPFLAELHAKATEPTCDTPFDFSFEHGYPHEMPKALLQRYMFDSMVELRREQAAAEAAAAAGHTGSSSSSGAPGGGIAMAAAGAAAHDDDDIAMSPTSG